MRTDRNENENIASTTAADLAAVAQDMLRMGKHWARTAQGWLEQRRDDLGERSRGGGYRQRHARGVGANGDAYGYRGVGPRNYTRSDERIREDLNERLTEADDLDASGISVEVSNGIATLNGNVGQRWMKHRAEDIADGCSGVRDVRNQIRVAAAGEAAAGTTGASTTRDASGTTGTARTDTVAGTQQDSASAH